MRAGFRDQLVGSLLLLFAVAWTVTVYQTVSVGFGSPVGPRAFPFWLGVALIVLSILLMVSGFRQSRGEAVQDEAGDTDDEFIPQADWWMAVVVFFVIVAYGFLMEKIGFELATLLAVSTVLYFVLKVRSPALVVGMALGMSIGCMVIFGGLLGAYLPPGSWISLPRAWLSIF